jgi:glucose-6-phosphate-specific signal transduction histidine kinase
MIERLKEMIKKPVIIDEPDDIRAIISAIRQDGKHIFRSKDIKETQRAGNRIAKMAKRILNILDEGE